MCVCVYVYVYAGAREGRSDRSYAPPAPEPAGHLLRRRSAQALEALSLKPDLHSATLPLCHSALVLLRHFATSLLYYSLHGSTPPLLQSLRFPSIYGLLPALTEAGTSSFSFLLLYHASFSFIYLHPTSLHPVILFNFYFIRK